MKNKHLAACASLCFKLNSSIFVRENAQNVYDFVYSMNLLRENIMECDKKYNKDRDLILKSGAKCDKDGKAISRVMDGMILYDIDPGHFDVTNQKLEEAAEQKTETAEIPSLTKDFAGKILKKVDLNAAEIAVLFEYFVKD